MARLWRLAVIAIWMQACGTAGEPGIGDPGPADVWIPEAVGPGDVAEGPDASRDLGAGDLAGPDEGPGAPDLLPDLDLPPEPPTDGGDAGVEADPGPEDLFAETTDLVEPDVPEVNVPSEDLGADAGSDSGVAETLEPWTQCREDSECQAVLGPQAWCNHDFPGGQCAGCDPYDLGHERCTLLGRSGLTLSCKETVPNVCLFDCPCPSWLRCADLGDLQVCVLKTCREDTECTPLVCRSLSEGGATYCLAPR